MADAHLAVSYSSKKYGWGSLDRDIERAVGRRADGAGTAMQTGERDMFFDFRRTAEAFAAQERVKRALGNRVKARARSGEQVERDWQNFVKRMERQRARRTTRRRVHNPLAHWSAYF